MSKHTPGPWRVGLQKHLVYQESPPERVVAICADSTMPSKKALLEEQANARLIAAAPELLEACEEALAFGLDVATNDAHIQERTRVYRLLMGAIAKAKRP